MKGARLCSSSDPGSVTKAVTQFLWHCRCHLNLVERDLRDPVQKTELAPAQHNDRLGSARERLRAL